MNHPKNEEWMAYVYGELPKSEKVALAQHLASCGACRKDVAEWQGAMQHLDGWQMPRGHSLRNLLQPFLKWGIAAAFAVGLGYGLGRFSVPGPQMDALRAGIENSLRASLEKEVEARVQQRLNDQLPAMWADAQAPLLGRMNDLAADAVSASSEQTRGFLTAYEDMLKNLDLRLTRQGAEIGALRKDTETMAVLTEAGFRQSEQRLVHLATFNDSPSPLREQPAARENP